MGTHFSFLFSIYSENHGVQAEQLNFSRSSDITYVDGDLCGNMLIQIIQFFSSTTNSFTWGALIVIGVIGKLNDAFYKKVGLLFNNNKNPFPFPGILDSLP